MEENYPLPEQPEPLSGNLILSVRVFAFESLAAFISCSLYGSFELLQRMIVLKNFRGRDIQLHLVFQLEGE